MRIGSQLLPFTFLALVIAAWFWPVTIMGQRPLGTEVTTFDLPRMTAYGRALHEGHLPVWNDRENFGTPMLAHGQIGVVYPFNLLFYRLLEPRNAYTVGLIFHMVLASWFAYLCARGFALGPAASVLAAVVFVGQGFFITHACYQWSYTTACWLPAAVLATWKWLDEARWRWLFVLMLVLAIQLLAGHFQIAFFTHVVVLLLGIGSSLFCRGKRLKVFCRSLLLPVMQAASLALAAVQLVPTAELLVTADTRGRGLTFLSSFAAAPEQLVNLIAPTLFQQHPLWDPIYWVPRHSAPAASLFYVGLLPFGLAMWGIVANRRDVRTRIWCLLGLVGLMFSLGPQLPGFGWLVLLPGFGWFSSPACWNMIVGMALGLLAGQTLEQIDPVTFGRFCRRYALVAGAVLVVSVAVIFASVRFTKNFEASPDKPLAVRLLSYGYEPNQIESATPSAELGRMLRDELTLPAIHIVVMFLVGVAPLASVSGKRLAIGILLWSALDLGMTGSLLRPVEFDDNLPLEQHSPVMREIAARGSVRLVGPAGMRTMIVGAAALANVADPNVELYWNPDKRSDASRWPRSFSTVPLPSRWGEMGIRLGNTSWLFDENDLEFCRLAGIRVMVCGLDHRLPDSKGSMHAVKTLPDPWLSSQVAGRGVLKYGAQASRWTFCELPPEIVVARAWSFPLGEDSGPAVDPRLQLLPPPARRRMLDTASPSKIVFAARDNIELTGTNDSPSVLVLSDLHYPGWEAVVTQAGESVVVPIEPAFGHWRAVKIANSGDYHVTFTYRPASFRLGWQITLGALLLLGIGYALMCLYKREDTTHAREKET